MSDTETQSAVLRPPEPVRAGGHGPPAAQGDTPVPPPWKQVTGAQGQARQGAGPALLRAPRGAARGHQPADVAAVRTDPSAAPSAPSSAPANRPASANAGPRGQVHGPSRTSDVRTAVGVGSPQQRRAARDGHSHLRSRGGPGCQRDAVRPSTWKRRPRAPAAAAGRREAARPGRQVSEPPAPPPPPAGRGSSPAGPAGHSPGLGGRGRSGSGRRVT